MKEMVAYRLRGDIVTKLKKEQNATYLIETLLDIYYNQDKNIYLENQAKTLIKMIEFQNEIRDI